jgi:hypothetical protein
MDMKVSTKFQINPSTNGWENYVQSDMGTHRPTDQPRNGRTDRQTDGIHHDDEQSEMRRDAAPCDAVAAPRALRQGKLISDE